MRTRMRPRCSERRSMHYTAIEEDRCESTKFMFLWNEDEVAGLGGSKVKIQRERGKHDP